MSQNTDKYLLSKKFANKKTYWRKHNNYYNESFADFIKFVVPEGSSILEVGYGEGDTINSLNPSPVIGIERNSFLEDNADTDSNCLKCVFLPCVN